MLFPLIRGKIFLMTVCHQKWWLKFKNEFFRGDVGSVINGSWVVSSIAAFNLLSTSTSTQIALNLSRFKEKLWPEK